MANPLLAGYNIVINQKVGDINTPIYPFTRTANVKDAAGENLDEIIAKLATKAEAHYVPKVEDEVSNIRFLRNDNSWATIQSASTTQAGIVQLSDATNLEDSTVAATAKAVKLVQDAIDALGTASGSTYVKKAQLGVATVGEEVGVATLDVDGKVPAAQLPSYVDDIVEVQMSADRKTATNAEGAAITPESGKIYVDAIGDGASNNTFRWSGSVYVEISESLALGETSSTAFAGDKGKTAYDHAKSDHARVDATKTESSTTNGYIKIDGAEVLVYTHPEGTNPHNTTKADVGLGDVENKSSETIRSEITSKNVVDALGFTPQAELGYTAQDASVLATPTNNGIMSAAYAAKLENCMQTAVSAEAPAFDNGIWFQIVE